MDVGFANIGGHTNHLSTETVVITEMQYSMLKEYPTMLYFGIPRRIRSRLAHISGKSGSKLHCGSVVNMSYTYAHNTHLQTLISLFPVGVVDKSVLDWDNQL